jgi:chromosome partitioning protein
MEVVGIPMAPVVLHRLKEHRDANQKGLTAQELAPDSRAAQEVAALWTWICAELHISTNADVHKKKGVA